LIVTIARREARVCSNERAAECRVLTRNGTLALVTHHARLSGKTCRHCINLYWAGLRKEGCPGARGGQLGRASRLKAASMARVLALWGKPRNSIALAAAMTVSA